MARLRTLKDENWRLAILLRPVGLKMNLKKVYRLYGEERFVVRRRGGRKRALGTRAPAGDRSRADLRLGTCAAS